jgi:Right handed beta helix region
MNKTLRFFLLICLFAGLTFSGASVFEKMQIRRNKTIYRERLDKKRPLGGSTFYVGSRGDDQKDGKTPETAWRSIGRVNQTEFHPGDRILFAGGETFEGNLLFDEHDLGDAEKPILVSSYGGGVARIQAGTGDGIEIQNAMGFRISRIKIEGAGLDANKGAGILCTNDLKGDVQLDYIRIDSAEVSGFGKSGILISGLEGKSGFSNVVISHCSLHHNAEAGMYIKAVFDYTSKKYAHKDVTVRYVKAYENSGKSGPKLENTGSGIVISDVENGLIERCVAHHNGARCNSEQGGPVGIWSWDSKNITIQYCESYENKTDGTKDGGGFDLDGGSVECVMQYNYSHENDGPGYLLAQFPWARDFHDNIVRYNISQNDCRKNSKGAIFFWGDARNTFVYNNTIFVSPFDANGSRPSGFEIEENVLAPDFQQHFPSSLYVLNNIFINFSGLNMVEIPYELPGISFKNNNYYASKAALSFVWSDKTVQGLDEWRKFAKQETDGARLLGMSQDPQFFAVGAGGTFDNADSIVNLNAYKLQPGSKMIDAGLDFHAEHRMKPPGRDFFGNPTPEHLYDLGAGEFISPSKIRR